MMKMMTAVATAETMPWLGSGCPGSGYDMRRVPHEGTEMGDPSSPDRASRLMFSTASSQRRLRQVTASGPLAWSRMMRGSSGRVRSGRRPHSGHQDACHR